ncbi:hypothetical protein BRC91_08970 [Halobacteriales archaeon QS_4_62_28]|nr:MAG: hypothetical protein BRC91_08970 [Halobacteriales archaeon QS_4_62_28]
MSRSSARGQTEPLVAVVAVVVVSLALSLYVGVLDAQLPGQRDRTVAETTVAAIEDHVAPTGVAVPVRLYTAANGTPSGYEARATLTTGSEDWTLGPDQPPARADRASRRVGIRIESGRVVPGRLRVAVWR